MSSPQDTEITLGTGKLLFLFFGLVAICAAFFAVGYSLGRKSEPGITTAIAAPSPQPAAAKTKNATNGSAQPPMTFYKSVEQKDATPDLTTEPKTDNSSAQANTAPAQNQPSAPNTPDPMTTLPTAGYLVQVAAVTKQDDAQALVDALKNKQYPAFIAAPTSDKFFHVQLGPFSDIKDAEIIRAKLISDGYNPILKK